MEKEEFQPKQVNSLDSQYLFFLIERVGTKPNLH